VQTLTDRDKKTLTRLYSDNDEYVAKIVANPPKRTENIAEVDPQRARVQKLHDEAVDAAKTGDFSVVAAKYEEALAIDPYEPGVLANLCKCYNNLAADKFKQGDAAAAEEILRKAVKTCEKGTSDAQLAFTLKNLGILLNATGKSEEGAKLLERAKVMGATE
jgi:tetratricopeptide (TPR) repeat protein